MIRAFENSSWSRKRVPRVSDSADMDMSDHMTSPVSLQAKHSPVLMNDPEKSPIRSPRRLQLSETQSQSTKSHYPAQHSDLVITLPRINQTRIKTPTRTYSIFPTYGLALPRESVSTTFSQGEEVIELPKPLFAHGHKRCFSGQSNATSATVQIGLRMSYPSHGLDPIYQSSLGTTRDVLFRSSTASDGSLHSIRGTPSHLEKKTPGSDISILPVHANEKRTPSQVLGPRANLLSPNWIFRNGSNSGFKAHTMNRDVMKSLPPNPTDEVALEYDFGVSSETRKPSWRHEAVSSQEWI